VNVIGMVSAYKEGRLVRGAISSLLQVGLDALYVFEGPAGEPLGDDVPDSDYPYKMEIFHKGRWRTDARKRNEMLQRAKQEWPGETWAVVIDGDEILHNAEYLRDLIQALSWQNEREAVPYARMPLRLIERDGSLSVITARVFRIDLVRSIDISSSLITNERGIQEGWGNRPELSGLFMEGMLHAIDNGKMICWPPFPCEPCIVHRSHLRHPARQGLRMSAQELVELERARAEAEA
jgi:hypothetical protein